MNENIKKPIQYICFGLAVLFTRDGMNWLIGNQSYNMVPRASKVEPGYVAPSDIEIKCKNLDKRNELPETFMEVKGKSYLLKKDKNGNPVLQKYKVKSQEIVPN